MKIDDNVICRVCNKMFCCDNCRQKHEIKNHAIIVQNSLKMSDENTTSSSIYLFCSICAKQPLVLKDFMYDEMLEHINTHHLPLRCLKCNKIYAQIKDLKEFSKCLQSATACGGVQKSLVDQSCGTDTSKATITKVVPQTTISTQTSPMRDNDFNSITQTPMSIIQLRWKTHSKLTQSEFISDSVSSIKNISNISNTSLRRSIGVGPQIKGKLVRSTSTPVNAELAIAKPKEPTFNASGEHVSSIYGSGCDPDSPAIQQQTGTPVKQNIENKNRFRKVSSRTKMAVATPLRQVMSKSIQKAIVEHGLCVPNTGGSTPDSPLDLRLSPALRRTQSDASSISSRASWLHKTARTNRELLLASQKLTTEQIVITRTQQLTSVGPTLAKNIDNSIKSNLSASSSIEASACNASTGSSVYKSCHSVEIITATETHELNIQKEMSASTERVDLLKPFKEVTQGNCYHLDTITPITRSYKQKVINKKLIQFETPKVESQAIKNVSSSPNSEVFFTPNSTPLRKSSIRIGCSTDLEDDYKEAVPRNLKAGLSPIKSRPAINHCAKNASFNRIENLNDDSDSDDVFYAEGKVLETEKNKTEDTNSTKGAGRLWSLMSSVIRLPSFSGKKELTDDININKNSLLKRCASIAGSLVRPKPLVDDEQLQTLKRKRTHTIDNQFPFNVESALKSPNSDGASVSSKRFRISARKPIERMRLNS